MNKQQKVRLATLLVVAAVFAVAVGRQRGWQWRPSDAAALLSAPAEEAPDPVDAISRMMDAARDGDVEAYLECFRGPLGKRLRQSVVEMTPSGFSKYLTENNRRIKGFAMYEPKVISEREARVRVEYVYADRNESQEFQLEKRDGRWKITRAAGAERIETLVPYGTPVN